MGTGVGRERRDLGVARFGALGRDDLDSFLFQQKLQDAARVGGFPVQQIGVCCV
jgi:hypothetical protein